MDNPATRRLPFPLAIASILIMLAQFPSPALADSDSDCMTAFQADDWPTAAAECQAAYEDETRAAGREHVESTRYLEKENAANDLAFAGYANLHFDETTGSDQLSEAIVELRAVAADPHCPPDVRADIVHNALPAAQGAIALHSETPKSAAQGP